MAQALVAAAAFARQPVDMNKGIKRGSDVKLGGPAKSSRSQSKAPCQIWPRLSQKEQGVVDARHNFCVILTELLRLDIIGIKNMTDATDVHRLQLTARILKSFHIGRSEVVAILVLDWAVRPSLRTSGKAWARRMWLAPTCAPSINTAHSLTPRSGGRIGQDEAS